MAAIVPLAPTMSMMATIDGLGVASFSEGATMPGPQSYAALQATHPGVGPYLIGLLYAEPPVFDREWIATRLRQTFGQVDFTVPKADELGFAIPERGGVLPNGARLPHMLNVLPADVGDLSPSLAQTWDWPLARDVVSRVRHVRLVSDIMAMALERGARVEQLDRFLRIAMEACPPLALHWLGSERIVDPSAYLAANSIDEKLSTGFVNVRLFRVENRSPGECVMDTLGLASFGLPDLQCHFAGIEAGAVARVLYNFAAYMFAHGDVLADGNTVEGAIAGSKWKCRHENAIVAPERVVVDLHPGAARPGGA